MCGSGKASSLVLRARQSEGVNEGNATTRMKLDRMLSSRFVDLTQMKSIGSSIITAARYRHDACEASKAERIMPCGAPMTLRLPFAALLAAAVSLLAGPVLARCSQNVAGMPGVQVASLDGLFLANGSSPNRATITFVGHASYQIDTPQGVRAITDYNGYNGFGRKPDIVTMNNAHSTHFTDDPEDGITYVLRGWPSKPGETEAKHDVTLKDMKVWNVPTNARDWGSNAARINGNSIFIFAIGDLCIAHLGHLHHRLTKEHLDELGRIDVLMVPIDGSFTMGVPLMVDVIRQIQPRMVLPMHYWGRAQVERFQGLMQPLDADFVWPDQTSLEVAREELPQKLTVIVLGGNGGD